MKKRRGASSNGTHVAFAFSQGLGFLVGFCPVQFWFEERKFGFLVAEGLIIIRKERKEQIIS